MKRALLWGIVVVCLLLNVFKIERAYLNGTLKEIGHEISSFFN